MPIMLTLSAFREGNEANQLQGTVFVKTEATHTVQQITNAFCRWSSLPADKCALHLNNQRLEPSMTAASAGLQNGIAVIVLIASDAPEPGEAARSAGFTVVDVMDSEMADLAGGFGL